MLSAIARDHVTCCNYSAPAVYSQCPRLEQQRTDILLPKTQDEVPKENSVWHSPIFNPWGFQASYVNSARDLIFNLMAIVGFYDHPAISDFQSSKLSTNGTVPAPCLCPSTTKPTMQGLQQAGSNTTQTLERVKYEQSYIPKATHCKTPFMHPAGKGKSPGTGNETA